jgi:hypothetical protein
MRLILLLLVALGAAPAWAGTWSYTNAGWPNSPYTASDPASLCAQVASVAAGLNAPGNPPTYAPVAYTNLQTVYVSGVEPNRANQCIWTFEWANGSTSGVSLDIYESASSGGGSCTAGEKKIVNVTMGWARSGTPNAADIVGTMSLGPGDSINAGGCQMGRPYAIVDCYRSAEPSVNGLYRISCDYEFTQTGTEGATPDAKANPATPPEACAGTVGEVNGRKVCVGTPNSPLPPAVGTQPAGQNTGNPAAGPRPTTGPGSADGGAGRTPLVGNGGNDGGGSSAAIPPGGNTYGGGAGGTGQVEVTVETCGLPGKPACRMDETGTPDVPENTNQQKVDSATQAIKDFIANPTSAVPEFPQLNWSFQLPTGCTAISTPAFAEVGLTEIDICQFQPVFHDLMSVVWVLGGLFGAISLFVRNALYNG